MKQWFSVGLVLAGLGICGSVRAEEAKTGLEPKAPAAAEEDKQSKAVKDLPTRLSVSGIGILGLSGQTDEDMTWGILTEADFPIGNTSLRGLVGLELTSLPGPADPDQTLSPEAFARYARVALRAYAPVGGNLGLYGEVDWHTKVADVDGAQRYPRRRHLGLMVYSQRGFMQIGLGSDDAAITDAEVDGLTEPPDPFGHFIAAGRISLDPKGTLWLGGEAVLAIKGSTLTRSGVLRETRDYMLIKIGVSFNRLGWKKQP